jgi:mRNA-degrading endonuclease RelE of RelBE toxin-antitoxin system
MAVRAEVSKHGRRRVKETFYERIKSDWRIRVGDHRVIYEIDEEVRAVKIMRIRHRREAYR